MELGYSQPWDGKLLRIQMQLQKDSKQQFGMETHLDNYKHAKSGNVNLC